jgi:predicted branched-subunit amino acid permease
MRAVLSIPAAILLTSMAGYGVLCRESGLSFGQAIFSTAAIWALPSQVVLVSAIAKGVSLPVTAIGVALSAIRFVPMIASWVPLVRTEKTRQWQLYLLSHFVAVTSWVVSTLRLPDIPAHGRVPFFAAFGITLATSGTVVTGATYALAGSLPPVLAGVLFFLTPPAPPGSADQEVCPAVKPELPTFNPSRRRVEKIVRRSDLIPKSTL